MPPAVGPADDHRVVLQPSQASVLDAGWRADFVRGVGLNQTWQEKQLQIYTNVKKKLLKEYWILKEKLDQKLLFLVS